jgi:Protein of unknown function (DUF992)
MMMKKIVLLAAAASLAAAPASFAAGSGKSAGRTVSEPGQRIGSLSCEIDGGVGLVLGSSRKVDCQFRQQSGRVERYTGTIGKLGLDIGVTGKSYMNWIVVNTAEARIGEGALAGDYVGASASASVGIGVGANALIGGSARNFALQPVSAQVGTGINLAAGVSRLQLRSAG